MSKVQSISTTIVFVALIFGFCVATLFHQDIEYSETENRTLAQMPEVSFSSLTDGSFESDYEEYLSDQFFLRDNWISLKTLSERVVGRTESKDIFFADDDYLIEAHTGTFTSDLAKQNISTLKEFSDQYVDTFGRNHMTVMVIPNAVDILRDKLPAFASPYDEELYLAQIKDALPEGIVFDASSVLQAHSGEELYYRTDHHWTTLAAFYVYQAWAKEMGLTVPESSNYEIEAVTGSFEGTVQSKLGIHTVTDTIEEYLDPNLSAYTVEKDNSGVFLDTVYDESALDTKNKYDYFLGGNNALISISTQADSGRRILVIKDSYAHCFAPFLLSEFEEIDLLDIRYYNQELSALIEEGQYTDLLFLYNASGFAEDVTLGKLLF